MQDSLRQLEYLPVPPQGECSDARRGWRDHCRAWGRVAGIAALAGLVAGITVSVFVGLVLITNISP